MVRVPLRSVALQVHDGEIKLIRTALHKAGWNRVINSAGKPHALASHLANIGTLMKSSVIK